MARQLRNTKHLVYVFCEGESEQAYADFLKKTFSDVVVIEYPKGLFEEADSLFQKNKKYRDRAEVTDEIWFFFDVENKDVDKWESRCKIIKRLRALRKKPGIRVRLLMTTACIEYWLMLHYKAFTPTMGSVADKENMRAEVIKQEPHYKKGDYASTARIAARYPTAVENAEKILKNLESLGLPCLEDTDERNQWLYKSCLTFSTVYEAILFLESLKK